jgi:predicted phosphoadenosine phosphosulfate sulfurtransferase
MNVHQAAVERMHYIFDHFENIYVSLSGGKDSGVMANIAIDIARERNRKITILYIDMEAMYQHTIFFIEEMILPNLDIITPHWVCLPMRTTNSVSIYEPWWTFWEESKREKWVRDLPKHPFIIQQQNHPFPFFTPDDTFEKFIEDYAIWQSSFGKTACLVGIRQDESLNRWRAINRQDVARYNGLNYSVKMAPNCYNFYPIHDWHVKDIWTYNGKFRKPYNKVYDLMHRAGVPLHKMRICEPFGDEQKAGLNLFRVIEPETWAKLLDRVSGANFGNIYCNTKATGYQTVQLPAGHTWKSYTKFLLATLPDDSRHQYTSKFIKFIQYWRKHGSPLTEDLIKGIQLHPFAQVTESFSTRGSGDKRVVRFSGIPDTITGDTKTDMLSWRRMCMAIIKNDITCRTLSFSITKSQMEKRKSIIEKYKSIL